MNHRIRTETISMLISCTLLLSGTFSVYATVPDSHVNSTNQTTIESTEEYSSNENNVSNETEAAEERNEYLDEAQKETEQVSLPTGVVCMAETTSNTTSGSEFVTDVQTKQMLISANNERRAAEYDKNQEIKKKKEAALAKKKYMKKLKKDSPDMWVKPTNGSQNKPYEPYYAITNTTSKAYKFQCKSSVKVDPRGFLMENNTWYCVALGSYFGHVGDKFLFTLSSGKVIPVVIADMKANKDTDSQNYLSYGGHIVEFLINPNSWYMVANGVKKRGNLNILPELKGKVTRIQKVTNEA